MKRQSIGDKVVNVIFYIILGFFVILCFYPVWYAFLASFSDPTYINSGKLIILPRGLTFGAYKYALAQRQLWLGYANTILYTVAGTLFGLIVCLPAGYALSRNDLPFRKIIMALFVFTMYFGGGLIPTYIVASTLHLVNTRWILIMFGSVSVYNMILIRTFCGSTIPEELREAASMDGCSNTRFFFTFVLPLSKAIIAVISLYYAVGHWNAYFNAFIYLSDYKKYPLQVFLRDILIMNEVAENATGTEADMLAERQGMADVLKYALIVVSTAPILCIYPFVQKYFVQGVLIGSLKE